MKSIIVPGGGGFLGTSLRAFLPAESWSMTLLSRRPQSGAIGVRELGWDGRTVDQWSESLNDATAVVNLTGRSINCRFTTENRHEILSSRLNSVRAVGAAIRSLDDPPSVWIQASAVGFYGDSQDRWCDEATPAGEGFIADVCRRWEEAFAQEEVPGTRKVVLRIGPVLGRGGGALEKLAGLTRRGLGGTVGNGNQYFPWIHAEDMNRLILWAIENSAADGIYNAVAPNPARNSELMRELRKSLGVPFGLPAPALAVKLGAPILGVDASLALEGQRCRPARSVDQGFDFRFSKLPDALANLLS